MNRAVLALGVICQIAPVIASAQPVVLSADRRAAPGFIMEEATTVEVNDGKMQMMLGSLPIKGEATALLRDRLTRTFQSADEQQIEFHECTRSILFTFSNKPPGDPKLSGGQLSGKKLRGTREDDKWKFALVDGKPKPPEENAIKQFAAFNIAVESLSRLYGDEPREVGKPWRPDFSALSRDYPGITVTIDCRLDEVAQRDGDECAKITVGGLVTGKYGESNRMEVRFTGSIIRSLRDQVDIDVALAGILRFHGALGKADEEGKGSEAMIEAPVTLKRTVKVTKRPNAPP